MNIVSSLSASTLVPGRFLCDLKYSLLKMTIMPRVWWVKSYTSDSSHTGGGGMIPRNSWIGLKYAYYLSIKLHVAQLDRKRITSRFSVLGHIINKNRFKICIIILKIICQFNVFSEEHFNGNEYLGYIKSDQKLILIHYV